MMTLIQRSHALELLNSFIKSWEKDKWDQEEYLFADNVKLNSSHRGEAHGREAVIDIFHKDKAMGQHIRLVTTNYYIAADGGGNAMLSAYLYGEVSGSPKQNPGALFGGIVRLSFEFEADTWKIGHLLINIGWVEGSNAYLPDWILPPGEAGWRPGDPPPTLVSELDSPWASIAINRIASTVEEKIAESYSRYSWGIDQNDFGLFRTSYTEDASGQFPPLGPLSGLHSIVGSLKEFRRHWPWMQHYGVTLKITKHKDSNTAEMWVGRLIPGRIQSDKGEWLYGAHYRIELREEDGIWKFSWSEYVPGWFSERDMPFKR